MEIKSECPTCQHGVITELTPVEEAKIIKLLNGALKDTINNHGPITSNYVSSASKRMLGMLKNQVAMTIIANPVEKPGSKVDDDG